MGGLSAIGGAIGNTVGRGIEKATNSRAAKWLGNRWNKDPEGTLALATVTSIILKDGIGCAMYVTQSLNNKKIPDEKRKFVAALDLTNGVLMIAAQIAMFFAMRKYSGPIFEKLFKKSFGAESKANMITKAHMESKSKKLPAEKDFEEVKKDGLDLFKFVADIAAATIIGKRVIVPLIATPLAKKVEKKMQEHADAKNQGVEGKEKTEAPKVLEDAQKPVVAEVVKEPTFVNNGDTNLLNPFKK